MPHYRFRAVDTTGEIRSGDLEAPGLIELEHLLARRGLELLSARRGRHAGRRGLRLTRPALIGFLDQLQQLLAAGLPLLDILEDLASAPGAVAGVARELAEAITSGSALSSAMRRQPRVFEPVLANLVEAGELSGRLGELLKHAVQDLRWQDEQVALTRRVLLYPAIVGVTLAGAIGFLLAFVVPQLAGFLTGMGQALPVQTRALLACANALRVHGLVLLTTIPALLALATLAHRWSHAVALKTDSLALRLPVLGPVLAKLALSRLCSVIALLYGAGITVPEALAGAASVTRNRALRAALETARRAIDAGESLSASFEATGLFPPLLKRMLRVGEQTGRLDLALGDVAASFACEAREAVARLQILLMPALVGVLGLVVLWVVWAVFGPLYALLTQLKV